MSKVSNAGLADSSIVNFGAKFKNGILMKDERTDKATKTKTKN